MQTCVFQSMFIRVKRKKSTYFVNCEPSETVAEIKQKVHALTDVAVDQQRLILLSSRVVLDDNKSLANQKVSKLHCHLLETTSNPSVQAARSPSPQPIVETKAWKESRHLP